MKRVSALILGTMVSALSVPLVVTSGCGSTPTDAPTATAAGAPAVTRVTAVPAERKTLRRVVVLPARVEAFDQARLYAKVPSYVDAYRVDIGDVVVGPRFDAEGKLLKRGQLLAELSAPELDREFEQKQALIAQSNADVEQSQAAVKVAEANALSADAQVREATAAVDRFAADYDRWSSEYSRMVQLVSKSAATQKVADETKSQMQSAAAARKEAEAKIDSARALLAASQAQVEKARADEVALRARRDVAEADAARTASLLDYLKIEAPFDGTIAERNAEIGNFAQPGSERAQPLFVVVRTDTLRVFCDVPELEAPLVDVGDRALVRVQALPHEEFEGTVNRTSAALDVTARTLLTEIDVENPDGKLRPGMYAQATLHLAESPDSVVIPATAVVTENGESSCFVIENGRAIRRPLVVGLASGNEVAITSGLKAGEMVAAGNGVLLHDGQQVELADAPK
jgi:HlyD family secretion protein